MEDFFEYYWLKILLLSKYLLLFFSIIYRLKPTIKIVLKNASAFKENVYLIIYWIHIRSNVLIYVDQLALPMWSQQEVHVQVPTKLNWASISSWPNIWNRGSAHQKPVAFLGPHIPHRTKPPPAKAAGKQTRRRRHRHRLLFLPPLAFPWNSCVVVVNGELGMLGFEV